MHRVSSRVIPGVATPSLVDLDIFFTNRRVHVLFIFFHAFTYRHLFTSDGPLFDVDLFLAERYPYLLAFTDGAACRMPADGVPFDHEFLSLHRYIDRAVLCAYFFANFGFARLHRTLTNEHFLFACFHRSRSRLGDRVGTHTATLSVQRRITGHSARRRGGACSSSDISATASHGAAAGLLQYGLCFRLAAHRLYGHHRAAGSKLFVVVLCFVLGYAQADQRARESRGRCARGCAR